MTRFDKSLVWFRRDLRNFDHAALHHALKQSRSVHCAFIFDKEILDALPRKDRRVEFIHASVVELDAALRRLGGGLIVRHGFAAEEIPRLAAQLEVDAVFGNHDYEPLAIARDAAVARALHADGSAWSSHKDQVVLEKNEVLSQAGKPFSVFTPYKNAWLKELQADEVHYLNAFPVEPYATNLAAIDAAERIPSLAQLGFEKTNLSELGIAGGMSGAQAFLDDFRGRIGAYARMRDFPAIRGTSCLSVHLRFGTTSIRGLVREALNAMRSLEDGNGAASWLSELVWREFYFMILHHHPHVAERAFKPEFDLIRWESGEHAQSLFCAWCEGRTGYPLVDAAMQQLNQTGYMHNRLRMVTASFLVKDLGVDWRWGERYFAQQLNDYDLAANNGGWQWAASTGCDAQPYFRIFNPVTQSEKFDPEGRFIRRYLPQLAKMPAKFIHAPWLAPSMEAQQAGLRHGADYPFPIVQHDEARKRTLARYAIIKPPSHSAHHKE
ncbi:MAG TPA: deoxyribodipyrimidine photo-lyase [Noviherbaspirillum sp.]|uniref:cryptochrome/photolyase family protein n=1 Tax=Noviherbaspirillum sp. TaxID=1926288 RepID=UPI002B4599BA|nr:deoxyribodipyrimidine photo-lyase [Noviherbaspirillum sp.]HJV88126.1 deoxyribodipyrimidine photo-lyase [Noviherbaspirillum sp.]